MSAKNKLIVDASIFTAFLAISNPHLTGNSSMNGWAFPSPPRSIVLLLLEKGIEQFNRRKWKLAMG